MIHDRECLAFGLEASDHLPAVHSGLEDLDGDAPAEGLRLLREVDNSESALADLFEKLERADDGSDEAR